MRKNWLCVAICCLLFSCAHVQEGKQTKPDPVRPPDIPSPVSLQIEKEKQPVGVKKEETFSFSLRDGDVRESIRAIGMQFGYNVVLETDVKGLSTLDLKNVTLEQALGYLLTPLGFTYKIEDKTIYVSKPKLEAKIFTVNYIDLKKTGGSTVYATPGMVGGSTTTTGSAMTTSSASGSQVSVKSETDSNLWKSLEENMKSLVSKEGKFVVNRQAMMVFVTDYPDNLKSIGDFLRAAEGVVQRQVMIEAKIVEVQLNDDSRQGVNWKFINARVGEFSLAGQQLLSSATTTSNQFFRVFVGNNNLDIDNTYIELLRTYGKVETVSSPKIATLNNQRAIH